MISENKSFKIIKLGLIIIIALGSTSDSLRLPLAQKNQQLNHTLSLTQLFRPNVTLKNFELPNLDSYEEKLTEVGKCYGNSISIRITLFNEQDSYDLAEICHNDDSSGTLYVSSFIDGSSLDESEPLPVRPSFREAGFYPDIKTDDCYKQTTVLDTATKILGSKELAEKYFPGNWKLYLSRGHLLPSGDGIEVYEKKATFYFVNASPQWQSINAGNIRRLEDKLRSIAEDRQSKFHIYTGTSGVLELEDVNGNFQEIWLGRSSSGDLLKKLPVPKLLWKVVHDASAGEGVAIVTSNNPWIKLQKDEFLCEDHCSLLDWVDWDVTDELVGAMYCCTVQDFYAAMPYAPNLGNLPLLTHSS